jgi:GR25 family glycosyltransferase involved in LPS biosynthesis
VPIYIINLEKRVDRKNEVANEIEKIFYKSNQEITFVNALPTPRNGAIGCSSSHAYALSRFLFETDAPACIILEDDFLCNDNNYFIEVLTSCLEIIDEWDVALLAHNVAFKRKATTKSNLFKILNSQTASAYIVNRKYAPNLIKLFFDSAYLLNAAIGEINNIESKYFYSLDMLWKNEQIHNNFIACFPPCSIQRESFSNIEEKKVNYKV